MEDMNQRAAWHGASGLAVCDICGHSIGIVVPPETVHNIPMTTGQMGHRPQDCIRELLYERKILRASLDGYRSELELRAMEQNR